MTGASAVPSSRRHERRDPSPSTNNLSSKHSDSSDEIEPFDERSDKTPKHQPEHTSTSLVSMVAGTLNCAPFYNEEEELEDGDLPSLSRTKKTIAKQQPEKSTLLGSGHKTTHPLKKPSKAGMEAARELDSPGTWEKKQQFWSQLDPPSPESMYTEDDDEYEDGPDDEMAARRAAGGGREARNLPRQRDEVALDESELNRVESDDAAANCFEYTLASLGNICGTGAPDSPPKLKSHRHAEGEEDSRDVEEQTAIEVEYVGSPEQEKASQAAMTWSPSQKNAYLAAMARKAKEDFEKKDREAPRPESVRLSAADERDVSDIYNSLSNSEKRKFLKLINSGKTPSESLRQVLEERQNKNKTPEGGRSRFSFWKKGRKGRSRSQDAARKEGTTPRTPGSNRRSRSVETPTSKKKEGLAVAGAAAAVGTAAAVAAADYSEPVPLAGSPSDEPVVSAPPASKRPVSPEAQAQARSPAPSEAQAKTPVIPVPISPVGSVAFEDVSHGSSKDGESEEAAEETPSPDQETRDEAGTGAVAVAVAAVAGAGVAAGAAATDTDEDVDSLLGQFEKSGVNYYDAVRKDLPEEDDDEEEVQPAPVHPRTRLATRAARLAALRSPRTKGFSELAESQSSELANAPSSPKPTRGIHTTEDDNVPAALSPKRQFFGIPIPSATGFSVLKDEDEGVAGKEATDLAPDTAKYRKAPTVRAQKELPSDAGLLAVEEKKEEVDRSEPVESTKAVVQSEQDDEIARRIERELLRPVATQTDKAGDVADNEDTVFDLEETPADVQETPADVQASPQRGAAARQLDTSIDSYMDAATIQSYGSSNVHEHGSVVSGKSAWTNATGASSVHTHSSRKRRPGAAKERIAKAKESERGPKKGWHESIQEAASKNHRVWDPARGWIDYEDVSADVPVEPVPKSKEKLHLSLKKEALGHHEESRFAESIDDRRAERVDVPFPEEWEKEREAMLPSSRGNRSWAESMKTASARVNNGKTKWDPERGWVGLDQKVIDSASPRSAESSSRVKEQVSQIEHDQRAVESSESDGAKFVAATAAVAGAGAVTAIALDRTGKQGSDSARPRSSEARPSTATKSDDSPLNTFITKSTKPTKNLSEQSTEGASDQAVASSGGGEKYMQLGDTGSVRSYVAPDAAAQAAEQGRELGARPSPENPLKVLAGKVADGKRIDDGGSAGAGEGDSAPLRSADARATPVQVVKEKCDEDDYNLFVRDDQATLKNSSYFSGSSSGGRRGRGPVDVDEVDDMTSDEDEPSWGPDSFMEGDVSGAVFEKSNKSPLPESHPPKLQKPRRDTSPIIKKEAASSGSTQKKEAPSYTLPTTYATPKHDAEAQTIRSDHTGSNSGGSSVRLRAQQWESMSTKSSKMGGAKSDSLVGLAYESGEDRTRSGERRTARSVDMTTETQEKYQEVSWPNASDEARNQKQGSSGTSEWKSFLGKKQMALTAAAARRGEKRREPEGVQASTMPSGALKKDLDMALNQRSLDDDSLFEFGEGQSAVAARKTRSMLSGETPTDDVFSNLSPIRKKDEEHPDIERVSDSGTAVNQGTFMKRLQACAAPITRQFSPQGDTSGDNAVPSAHLAFLRTNPSAATGSGGSNNARRFVPPALCGRPDTISEVEESDTAKTPKSSEEANRQHLAAHLVGMSKPRSSAAKDSAERATLGPSRRISAAEEASGRSPTMSNLGQNRRVVDSDNRSVSSEDFGVKTSYLDAIAMKTAVSKSKSKKKSSSSSDVSSGSRRTQQKWQEFLDKRGSGGSSPTDGRAKSTSEVSKAAEKYAAEKVEEMMEVMASRPKSAPRSRRGDGEDFDQKQKVDDMIKTLSADNSASSPLPPADVKSVRSEGSRSRASTRSKKSETARAAEELAAAQVEAMMAAMTSTTLDEGEI